MDYDSPNTEGWKAELAWLMLPASVSVNLCSALYTSLFAAASHSTENTEKHRQAANINTVHKYACL